MHVPPSQTCLTLHMSSQTMYRLLQLQIIIFLCEIKLPHIGADDDSSSVGYDAVSVRRLLPIPLQTVNFLHSEKVLVLWLEQISQDFVEIIRSLL